MLGSTLRNVALAALLAFLPTAVHAHTILGSTSGFVHGFFHPLSGIDHILAFLMVGVFAWQLGGRAIWLVPATFIAVLALGASLGMAGINLPLVETGIAYSVIILGAIIALGIKAPIMAAAGLAGLFAIFHGYAHGAEMPQSAGALTYAAGFMLASAALNIAGISLGYTIGRVSERFGPSTMRVSGCAAAVVGVGILAGVV